MSSAEPQIEKPDFQLLNAKKQIDASTLEDVCCNLCGKQGDDGDFLFQEMGRFNIIHCHDCGLLYVSPQPTADTLHLYYGEFFTGTDTPQSGDWKHDKSFSQAINLVKKYVLPKKDSSLLEVGSGYGFFLEKAIEAGFSTITAVEPDTNLARRLQRKHPDIEVKDKPLEKVDLGTKTFDCIVMLASLEHFKNPSAALERLRGHLNSDGIIVIRVPYLEGYFRLSSRLGKNILPFGAPRHLYDFSPATLNRMLAKNGFEPLETVPGAPERANGFLYRVAVSGIKLACTAFWLLTFKRYMPPFIGSIVTIAKPGK